MQDRLDYGSRVNAVRKHFGLNRSAFAAKIGTSGTTVKNIEEGDTLNPGASLLAKIATEFGVNLNWLNNGFGEMFTSSNHTTITGSKSNATNTVSIGNHPNPGVNDLQAEIDKLRIENEYLKQRLKDKEEMIEILKRK